MAKVIVTGTNGFIGSQLVEELIARGDKVCCLFRNNSIARYLDEVDKQNFYVDYCNIDSVKKCDVFDDSVDYFFHVAGVTKGNSYADFYEGNVLPVKHILEALESQMLEHKSKLKRFVFISSLAAAGPSLDGDKPINELDEPRPIDLYGRSKLEAEEIVLSYADRIPITIIRPASVYGHRDKDMLVLFKMISRGVNVFYDNADKYISIINSKDLVRGIIELGMHENTASKIYHLANQKIVNWRELQNAIIKAVNKKVITLNIPEIFVNILGLLGTYYSKITGNRVLLNKEKLKLSKPKYWTCDVSRAHKDAGFTANIDLYNGIKETFDWYKKNGWL